MQQLTALLNQDPSNFRALELLCQVSVATKNVRQLLNILNSHLETIKQTNAATLLTISEALLNLGEDDETRAVASQLNVIASSRNLAATELRRAAVNLRKLREDDKALELIEEMFRKDPSLQRNSALLQLAGKAQIDLAKKCIDTARSRDTVRDMKMGAWDLCATYLSGADRNLRTALEFSSEFEREYIERDIEFLAHMRQLSQKPMQSSNRINRRQNQRPNQRPTQRLSQRPQDIPQTNPSVDRRGNIIEEKSSQRFIAKTSGKKPSR